MKKQDVTALHQLTLEELASKLIEVEKEYQTARLEMAADKRKNTHIRLIRDQVARIKTIITEKNTWAEAENNATAKKESKS